MKKILLIMLLLLLFIGCAENNNIEEKKELEKEENKIEQSIKDLDQLIIDAEKIHVDMYKHLSKEDFLEKVEKVKSEFKTGERVEFYKLVAPLFTELNANISLSPLSDYFTNEIKKGNRFFPFDLDIRDGKIFVKTSYTDKKIMEGSEILSINGKSANTVLDEMLIFFEGTSKKSKYRSLELEFPRLYYILNGPVEDYTIKYIIDGKEEDLMLKGAGTDNIVKTKMPNVESFKASIKDDLYIIDSNSFDKIELFKNFMKVNLEKINADTISKVVFDIRDNPGGDINYIRLITSYLTDKEITIYGDIYAKISEKVITVDQYMKDNYSDKMGETVKAEFNLPKRYFDVKTINKPVYIIVNERTRGVASLFAAVIQDNELGTIMGTETGTNPSQFNTPYIYLTDNLSIKVEIPYKYNLRPNKMDENSGVIPDIIKENIGDNIFE